ncbi:Hypothetical predicted protein [Mytilus galloprovincialis]|uniref:Thioredoxin domain-containing protein n=2 Tax=Mytilus galloprovincialis TaxID=29158 RepID=A0A8B6HM16_MYTGA|nr:Hypothetical predicted protein [Mytilus galloprovincialis]
MDTLWFNIGLAFLFLGTVSVNCKSVNEMQFQHMKKILDESELDNLRQRNEVSAVYYYKRDIPRLKGFLKELDKTAEYLKLYGVEVGFFDCGILHEAKEPKCNEHNAEFQIFTYRSNHVLLELGLETMFDVNSIMSNILQLVLIHDVPILQSVEERIEYENKYKGEKDILFTYQKAIGTFEHRIFMEVAFAYHDKFKFAVCTNKQAVQDLKDSSFSPSEKSIYVLRCKNWTEKDLKCPYFKYSKKYDLATLANFVKSLTYPKVFMMPSDGMEIPFYQDKGLHVGYFFYNKDSKDTVLSAASDTADAFFTNMGIVAVDVDRLSPEEKVELDFHGSFPAVACHKRNMEKPVFMEGNWGKLQVIHQFLIGQLNKQDSHESDVQSISSDDFISSEDMDEDSEQFNEQDFEQFGDDEIEEVETQDDAVAEAVYQSRRKLPQVDLIDALTDKTFPTTIKNKDLVFVLFYLPFDDKSMAFLYAYADASKEIESDPARPLTRVNCHDWTDVCGNEKINIYPTMRMYRNGKMLKDYKGLLDSKAVVTTVKLLNQSNPVNLVDSTSIMDLMNGVLPNSKQVVTETVVMALLDKSHHTELKVFKNVASQLEDTMTFAYNNDGAASKIPDFKFKVPSIVVLRRSDILKPHVVYIGKLEVTEMKDFIIKASIPSMPELTVEWFPALYRQQKPFVILFLDEYQESARLKKVMEDIVISSKFPMLQFVWMNADPKSVGRSVLNEYDKDNRVPEICYVDLKKGIVFNNKDEYPVEDTVSEWLTSVMNEKIEPSKVLEQGDWKPKKHGYDFLSLIDKENERKKKKKQRNQGERIVEEHGVGFDKDGREINAEEERVKAETKNLDSEEDEIREELVALHKTRLYKSGGGRRHKDHPEGSEGKVTSPPEVDGKYKATADSASHQGQKSKEHKSKHTEL